MVTRTITTAVVSYEKIFKDEKGSVVTEQFETRLEKCDTREKAEIILEKENKGAIVTITNIQFEQSVYKLSDEVFIQNAELVKTELVDENVLLEKAEGRKRK